MFRIIQDYKWRAMQETRILCLLGAAGRIGCFKRLSKKRVLACSIISEARKHIRSDRTDYAGVVCIKLCKFNLASGRWLPNRLSKMTIRPTKPVLLARSWLVFSHSEQNAVDLDKAHPIFDCIILTELPPFHWRSS
jgi:hypothetical protein